MPTNPEVQLISAVMRSREIKGALAQGVTLDMFHTHGEEWAWIIEYYQKRKMVPPLSTFRSAWDLSLTNVTDPEYFAGEVKRHHTKFLLVGLVNEIGDDILAGNLETAIKKASTQIISVAAGLGTANDTNIYSDYHDILENVQARVRRVAEVGSAGIPFGFETLDRKMGGANPGEIIVVGARLGQGKSWILQYMSVVAALNGYRVLFDALEMSRAHVGMRIHTITAQMMHRMGHLFQTTALMQGKDFDPREYKRYLLRLKKEMPGRIHVGDTARGRVSPLTVAAQIETHEAQIVFIDYLTLMDKSGPDWQGVAQLSSDMKNLATMYNVPIVEAAQLNREGSTGKEPPGPEALAYADAIGQDADVILNMRQQSDSVIALKAVKNRNGPGGFKIHIQFEPGKGVIREISWNKAQELMDADKDREDGDEERPRQLRRP